jgi:uncharacterized protein YqeY
MMEDPKAKMQDALKQAMLSKNNERRDVLRMALNAIKQVEIDERKTLTPEEVAAVLQREVKTRREAVEEARKAGREETVQEEAARVQIIEEFLPQQLSRDEVKMLAEDAVRESGAASAQDMGKVMGLLMPKVKGKADGKIVNEVVRELLNS